MEGFRTKAERGMRVGRTKSVHTPDEDPIRGTQLGSTLEATIEDQHLMPKQHRFGHDSPEST